MTQPGAPLYGYAADHEHVCPVCGETILACQPLPRRGAPMDDYQRADTPAHVARVADAMVEHRCPLAGQRIRYEKFLIDTGKVPRR